MASSARILIVDDDPGLLEAVATALHFHYEVLTAHTGQAAFEVLAHHPVDLVLLDHKLPDMEGMVLLDFPKRIFTSVPVIYMTAYGSEDLAVEFYDAGGRKYLRKPFKVSDLVGYVHELLAVRQQRRGPRRPVVLGGEPPRRPAAMGCPICALPAPAPTSRITFRGPCGFKPWRARRVSARPSWGSASNGPRASPWSASSCGGAWPTASPCCAT